MERVLEAEPLVVGAGEVEREADGVNTKHLGVFLEVLKESQSIKDVVLEYQR